MTLSGSGEGNAARGRETDAATSARKEHVFGRDDAWKRKENVARQQIRGETGREEADFDWFHREIARMDVSE